jgi:hypothetical protein
MQSENEVLAGENFQWRSRIQTVKTKRIMVRKKVAAEQQLLMENDGEELKVKEEEGKELV